MSQKLKVKIPRGMRDWLPGEAARKRQLVNELLQCLSLWGYEEINTPLLEYYQVLFCGEEEAELEKTYKLIDQDGRILVLRPELTIPIARVVSSKLSPVYPWRLMYAGEVFRYGDIQTGKQREFCQVGVELLGARGAEADSEVLALAIEALSRVGLKDFTVSLGHTGVLKGLLASLTWGKEQIAQVRHLILEKDFVGLGNYLLAEGMPAERCQNVLALFTSPPSWSDLSVWGRNLPDGVRAALQDLEEIVRLLKTYGYEQYVQIDLSTLREPVYYTGMVFEIYTAGIGYPIGGGGRYDQLLHNWGSACPATGFALGVERVLLSLPPLMEKNRPPLSLLVGTTAAEIIPRAIELRRKGERVMVQIGAMSRVDAEKLARDKGAVLFYQGRENDEGGNKG